MPASLLSPFSLRSVAISNRVVVSPMCQYSAIDGTASDWHLVNLGHLALSGPGLVFFEATHVNPEGRITPHCLGLYSDENERGLKRVVDFLKTWTQSRVGIQLGHAGRKGGTKPPFSAGNLPPNPALWQPVAPSALAYDEGWAEPIALDRAGIANAIADFVAAAQRARRAGVEVVELHFAHGYLAHQFLSPLSNRRDDEYGGTLENRMRFSLELFQAVRDALPAEMPVGVRLSATDFVEGGWDLDSSIVLVRRLAERGCDFVDVSGGGLSPLQKIHPAPGYQVGFAKAIRAATGMATIAVGMIVDPEYADRIVRDGEADFVALARGFLRDPRWLWNAVDRLGGESFVPPQYARGRQSAIPKPSPK
ncbi:MAG: NADH:flavin oxidoreductase/NADH oxidase [Candidatus Eremiobacteraeota bacterium]|nr:NADH:flavin oxidoreductase/NADH oxidase [Candidatus Eremiobacteraeota bacterium]